MKRIWIAAFLLSSGVAAAVLAWNEVRQEREFRRLVALGDASLARDQSSLAIEAFSGAVALKPDSMLGYLKRGDTYRRRSELAAALRDLRQAAALDPSATRPLELLGDVNMSMGRFERAAEAYQRFIGLDDRSSRVLYKLGLAHYRNAQSQAAVEPLRQALAIDERLSEAHYLLGLCLRDRMRQADAVREVRRAIELNPAFAAARAELAEIYFAMGRHREGIEQLEAVAAIEPGRPQRLIAVGLAYARAGRTDAAILSLGRAVDRYPQEAAVYAALGRVWLEAAEARVDRVALRKAIEALESAATRDATGGETLALYGRALFLAGDVEGAERALARAASSLPVDPLVFLYLSAAARRLAHTQTAEAALADYATLSGPQRAEAGSRLADLLALQRRFGTGDVKGGGALPDPVRPGDHR